RGLPLFESVWLDALVQARFISLYQATEIAAGRGDSLRIGPAIVVDRLATLGPWSELRGRGIESRRPLRIVTYSFTDERSVDHEPQLARLVERSRALEADPRWAPIQSAGQSTNCLWAVCAWRDAEPLAARLASRGRLPLPVAIELLRQLAAALVELETAGLVHGDLSVHGVLLTPTGQLSLWAPGLRAIARPSEGFAAGSLPAECCDTLAPERIRVGTPPTVASDIYACGAIAWHMLAGRPLFPGADSLAKLRAICVGNKPSLARLVPDLPAEIEATILACLSADDAERPRSYRELASRLGEPTRAGRRAVLRTLASTRRTNRLPAARRSSRGRPVRRALVAALLLAAIGIGAWMWSTRLAPNLSDAASQPARQAEQPLDSAEPLASTNDVAHKLSKAAIAEKPTDQSTAQVAHQATIDIESRSGAASDHPANTATLDPSDVLLLPTDRPLRLQKLAPRAGQTVCGSGDRRPQVVVPPGGLLIDAADVRFVGIDFRAAIDSDGRHPLVAGGAMLVVTSPSVTFERCTFAIADAALADNPSAETAGASSELASNVAAIAWQTPRSPTVQHDPLPSGTLIFSACSALRLGLLIDAQRDGALRIDAVDCLLVDTGPIVRLDRLRRSDEPLSIALERCTLRDVDSLIDYEFETPRRGVGPLTVTARDCVLAPRSGGALVQLLGRPDPDPLLERILWRGSGSLVPVEAPLVQWFYDDGPAEIIGDDELAVVGLARGLIEFAGPPGGGPAASLLSETIAPIGTNVPPGIGADELPWPGAVLPIARRP
ncbi:MAG: serine/threonine protein kinase, partial [Pirellulales bacterium]